MENLKCIDISQDKPSAASNPENLGTEEKN